MTEQSKDYAEALFALAAETGAQKDCLGGLEFAQSVLFENPEYIELLASPAIPQDERTALLEEALSGAMPEHALSFVQLLCAHGRIRSLPDCVEEYRRLYQASVSLSTATVTSAVALTEEQKQRLTHKLEQISGRTVLLSCTVDESLLGGITVQLDGTVLDGSLRHRLHEVKEVMEQ